jgi:C4-dicarboxylate-specific signal transduction histidine kinase
LKTADIVEETRKTLQYLEKRSSDLIHFRSELPKKKVMLPLNTQLFSWTLENLIKNGIDAMKGKGKINLILTEQARAIHIEISDSGTGIKKEHFKKIFSPGFTSKKRGWGLGLSLSKRIIVDYHKGKINIKSSELNRGTTFEIVLKRH